MNLQGTILSEKNPVPKDYILYGSISRTFYNSDILEVEDRLVVSSGYGVGTGEEKGECDYKKGTTWDPHGVRTARHLGGVSGNSNIHRWKLYRTSYTLGEI